MQQLENLRQSAAYYANYNYVFNYEWYFYDSLKICYANMIVTCCQSLKKICFNYSTQNNFRWHAHNYGIQYFKVHSS